MPDQFGNPLPGESPSFINITGAPVPGVVTPPQVSASQAGTGAPALEIPDYSRPQLAAPAAPIAPAAQQPEPAQFVSAPGAKPADVSALLAPVGEIGTGSSTTVSKTDLGKAGQDAAKAREEANAGTVQAIGQQEAIEQERANIRAAGLVDKARVADAADAQIKQYTTQLQKDTAAGVADIKRSTDDFERAAAELGPDHFWQVQSTGQKIGNLLAIALSGIGQAFSAKAGIQARNGAMDLINAAIDRDIDMQKTSLMAKERGIRTKESLYSTLRQKGADDLAAMAATKAADLGRVDRQIEAAVAATDSAEAKARGNALRTQVQAAQAAELQRVAEATATRVQSTAGSRPVSGLEVAQMQAGAQAAQQDAERERLGLVKKDPKLQVEGFGQATDPESKRELVKAKLAFDPAERALKVMERLGKKTVLGPGEEALFDAARSTYTTFVNGPFGANLGALSGPDKELLDAQVPTRTAWKRLSGQTDAVQNFAQKRMDIAREALKGYTVRTQ